MTTPNFDHIHPKIIETTFSFPEFALARKKLVQSICSLLRYSQFKSPVTRLATPNSHHAHRKTFWSTFNLCEFVSTCQKSCYFIDLFWGYSWLKSPAIWLADIRNKNFTKYGICAGTQHKFSLQIKFSKN